MHATSTLCQVPDQLYENSNQLKILSISTQRPQENGFHENGVGRSPHRLEPEKKTTDYRIRPRARNLETSMAQRIVLNPWMDLIDINTRDSDI